MFARGLQSYTSTTPSPFRSSVKGGSGSSRSPTPFSFKSQQARPASPCGPCVPSAPAGPGGPSSPSSPSQPARPIANAETATSATSRNFPFLSASIVVLRDWIVGIEIRKSGIRGVSPDRKESHREGGRFGGAKLGAKFASPLK
ncbi:MAG: hypothetical protein AMJ59_01460 [Gammaproteobacteria bacterium SG8_31]|nr:MAG: hypothetical protein AMJ59_01460 [Gammaproteobacteria bacterium SG8_31]